jgi:hypothetical protein
MAAKPWPTSGISNPETFKINPMWQVVGEQNPYHGAREVMLRWHQWHAFIQWNHTTYSDYLGMFGHFADSDGGIVIYQIPIFSYRTPRGSKAGSVTLSGAHAAGLTSLTITGGSGVLLRGDWIQIGEGSGVPRAYVITSSEAGGVIQISPALRGAETGGVNVHHLGTVTQILDSMELTDPDFAASMPSPSPGYFQPFALEFVSALRVSP